VSLADPGFTLDEQHPSISGHRRFDEVRHVGQLGDAADGGDRGWLGGAFLRHPQPQPLRSPLENAPSEIHKTDSGNHPDKLADDIGHDDLAGNRSAPDRACSPATVSKFNIVRTNLGRIDAETDPKHGLRQRALGCERKQHRLSSRQEGNQQAVDHSRHFTATVRFDAFHDEIKLFRGKYGRLDCFDENAGCTRNESTEVTMAIMSHSIETTKGGPNQDCPHGRGARSRRSHKRTRSVAIIASTLALQSGALAVLAGSASGQGNAVQTLKVKAAEAADGKYSFDAIPDTLNGGNITIEFTNPGKFEHDITIVRIDGNRTVAQVTKVVNSEAGTVPAWMHASGGVGHTPPGGVSRATVNLGPGKYVFMSTVTDEKTKKSDAASGMAKLVKVTGAKAKALPSGATASIVAKEYGFEVTGLKAGTNTVTFSAPGKQLHHFQMFPMLPGKTTQDVVAFLSAKVPPAGPPPVDFENSQGSAVTESSEGPMLTDVTLTAGRYAIVCFMSDRAGGPPHFMKGMITEALVK
jgi:hypothetical protein